MTLPLKWKLITFLLPLTLLANPTTPKWNLYPSYYRHLHRMPKSLSKQIFFKANTTQKVVALTFDDGPLGKTAKLLRFLHAHHTPATFFLLAPQLSAAKARRYDDPLFEVGLHGYHHYDFRKLSPRKVTWELDRALRLFHKHNLHPRYFRPPYGMVSPTLLHALTQRHLHTILWSIDSQDWNHYRGQKYLRNILTTLTPGSIILMHDQSESLKTLEKLIEGIRGKGYQIVPLSRLEEMGSLVP